MAKYQLYPPGKRGPSWYFRFDFKGRRLERPTGELDRESAERYVIQYLADLYKAKEQQAARREIVTFADALAAYRAFKPPRAVDEPLFDKLEQRLGDTAVTDIDHSLLVDTANALYFRRSNATKNRSCLVPAAAVLHYAASQRWCDWLRVPLFKVPLKTNRRPASTDDVMRLLAEVDGPKWLIIAVIFETGLRITDALYLTADRGEGKVNAVRIAKTDDWMQPFFSEELEAKVAASERYDGDHLFPWRTRSGVYKWLLPLRRRLGIHWHPHLSRHALATELLRRGVPDRDAAAYGGWADTKSLHRYQQHAPARLVGRSAYALLRDYKEQERERVKSLLKIVGGGKTGGEPEESQ
jgi:site-specific recombinase XerD